MDFLINRIKLKWILMKWRIKIWLKEAAIKKLRGTKKSNFFLGFFQIFIFFFRKFVCDIKKIHKHV